MYDYCRRTTSVVFRITLASSLCRFRYITLRVRFDHHSFLSTARTYLVHIPVSFSGWGMPILALP